MPDAPLVLVVNSGSSSLRVALVDPAAGRVPARGHVERIGAVSSIATVADEGAAPARHSLVAPDHAAALEHLLDALVRAPERAALDARIAAVGHRVVHGGERFSEAALVDDAVAGAIADAFDLAPLHNPANLRGIEAARRALPDLAHVAVFDTAFHQTMPPRAFTYAVPERLYRLHRIRRYGFHGPSHFWVSRRLYELAGLDVARSRIVTCHLGNGASMAAIAGGASVDTSMGLTPLAGLVMGTRSGDVDPSIVFELVEREGLSLAEVHSVLNRQSGLLGLSGYASDMRDVLAEAARGDARCRQAIEVYCYRARCYLGQYFAAMNGCDAIAFTAGVGENSPEIRAGICADLGALGIELDAERNRAAVGVDARISSDASRVAVWVVRTDEERVIAADALRVARAARDA